MNIAVVGGSGAIGRELIRHWLGQDHNVHNFHHAKGVEPRPKTARLTESFYFADSKLHGPVDLLVTCCASFKDGKMGKHYGETCAVMHTLDDTLGKVISALSSVEVKDGGNVVVIGSVMGRTGGYGCAAYAAAKAGLVGLVRSYALENAARGVCANVLELGYVDAGMGARLETKVKERALASIPLKRFATPEEVVEMVAFLGKIRYATGQVFPLTGGL